MKLDIRYGRDGHESVHIPDERLIGVFSPNEVEALSADDEIEAALDSPFGAEGIEAFLQGGKDVVFIVNDGTRPTPTAQVLQALSRRMDLRKARFLIATGTHRAPTDEEYDFIFGELYESLRDRIHSHDCHKDPMVDLGSSKNGTVMEVNRMAVEADRLVIITSVEPHYFAGYTGGRKSFLPGVASFRTVEQNHRLAMRPEAQALALDGNPVHEDMMDALKVVEDKKIFSIQTVLDRHQQVYKAAAGDLHQAFFQAVRWADEVFSVSIPEKADVVVSIAPYPMDVDLYQSQKALDNGKWALKEGGTIIMVSKCREGIGHQAFMQQLCSCADPQELIRRLNLEYRLGHHKAAKMAEISTWARIFVVSDLEPAVLTAANLSPFPSVQEALDAVWEDKPDARVLVLTEGSITIPKVQ